MSKEMIEYRYGCDFTPMVDKIAAQIQYHIDQAALDKVESKLAEFGYVKVVRCRDCKHFVNWDGVKEFPWCVLHDIAVKLDGFCWRGKRKEGGE